ncbi:MAG: GlxA family transcriptional regulator, partial [Dongiaceae bacterium]
MFGARPKELPQDIGFLLVPLFSMIAFVSALEPLRLANRASGRQLYRWRVFSPDGRPVTASNGLEIRPEGALDELMDFSTVVV